MRPMLGREGRFGVLTGFCTPRVVERLQDADTRVVVVALILGRGENLVEGHHVVVVGGGVGSSYGAYMIGVGILVPADAVFVLGSETVLVESLGGGFKYGLEVKHVE